MASLTTDKKGLRRIQFVMNGERPTIRLGRVSLKAAESFKLRIERLVEARQLGGPLSGEMAEWVAGLDRETRDKLAKAGLIDAKPTTPLKAFLDDYIDRQAEAKPATKVVWRQVVGDLVEHFGADRDMDSIAGPDAERFKAYLVGRGLASTTVAKRLQFARKFFAVAVKQGVIRGNPFADVRGKAVLPPDRERYVSEDEAELLLAACPNAVWRAIVGLARYGGLRCPSEVLTLRWGDVLWDSDRIHVRSPKTEHITGKESRVIPMIPPLRRVLEEAFDSAPDGAVYVIHDERLRNRAYDPDKGWKNCNTRTQFTRIVRRAGLQPWKRIFHALRASRATDVASRNPKAVLEGWLGHTEAISLRHYQMIRPEDFAREMGCYTCGGAKSGAPPAQKAAQQPSATGGNARNLVVYAHEKTPEKPGFAEGCSYMHPPEVEAAGFPVCRRKY